MPGSEAGTIGVRPSDAAIAKYKQLTRSLRVAGVRKWVVL
jgi:hypothetical protein